MVRVVFVLGAMVGTPIVAVAAESSTLAALVGKDLQAIAVAVLVALIPSSHGALFGEPLSACEAGTIDGEGQARPVSPRRPDWRILTSFDKGDDRVTKLRVVLYKKKPVVWEEWVERQVPLDCEVTDPRVLHLVQVSLPLALRTVWSDEDGDRTGGKISELGYLVVTSEKQQFIVGMTTAGFTFQSKEYHWSRLLYSWTLAKAIDDVVSGHTGQAMPEEMFKRLSGERYLESDRGQYKSISSVHPRTGHSSALPGAETHRSSPVADAPAPVPQSVAVQPRWPRRLHRHDIRAR